jgi:predicted acyltransferase
VTPPVRSASQNTRRVFHRITLGIRILGFASLIYLAFAFRGPHDQRIITLGPLFINAQWWGILGSIGWAYLMASIVFLIFRTRQLAVLGCVVLMVALYFAEQAGTFNHFWPAKHVSFGKALGTHAMLTTAGMMLGIMLMSPDMRAVGARIQFTILFVLGFAAAALLLNGQFGISKNNATPSWGMWSCAFTATVWLLLYLIGDVLRLKIFTMPLAIAGRNVLLAYIISLMFNSTLQVINLSSWYSHLAPDLHSTLIRSGLTAVFILALTFVLNSVGFALKL